MKRKKLYWKNWHAENRKRNKEKERSSQQGGAVRIFMEEESNISGYDSAWLFNLPIRPSGE